MLGHISFNPGRMLAAPLTCAVLAIAAANAQADYTVVADQFKSNVIYTPVSPQGGFTVHDGNLYSWNWGGTYSITNLSSNSVAYQSSATTLDGNGYGDPLGIYDSSTGSFYAGTYGYSGSGLWRYNSNNTWTKLGVFDSLYGADTYQGRVYASGLNTIWNGSSGQENVIALYDLSGNSQHDVLIQATGNSASVAVDKYGNVYYANYGNLDGTLSGLRMWTAAQIDSVRADLGNGQAGGGILDTYLTYADSTLLCELPGGANGITVDDAGNVFVSYNGSSSGILMWNADLGIGNSLVIAELDWGWAGFLDAEGDVLNGGTLYAGSAMFSNDMTLITHVPEPMTAGVLTCGAIALLMRRGKSSHS